MKPAGLTATLQWTNEQGHTAVMGTIVLLSGAGLHNDDEVVLKPFGETPWIVRIEMRATSLWREPLVEVEPPPIDAQVVRPTSNEPEAPEDTP